jgi:hypothetical protein
MLPACVHESSYGPAMHDVQPTSLQWKTVAREIPNDWREIQPTIDNQEQSAILCFVI